MDDKNSPILDSNTLEAANSASFGTGVVTAPTGSNNSTPAPSPKEQKEPPSGRLKRLLSRVNLYFILLVIIMLALGGGSYYAYLKNRSSDQQANVNTQELTQDSLDKLAGTDSTVGDPKQTLSVESNAIFSGGVLIKGNIDVAGTIKVGGALSLPGLSVGGTTSLDQAALKSLTVSGDSALQGKLSLQNGLAVTGGVTVSGNITAGQISADTLLLNKDLQLSHHIVTSGGTPSRSTGTALGGGGTASNSGTDTAGTITINTGNAAPAGCFISITFTTAFTSTPHVVISPASSSAAGISYYTTRTASGFSVCTASDPPDSTASIIFDYIVVN